MRNWTAGIPETPGLELGWTETVTVPSMSEEHVLIVRDPVASFDHDAIETYSPPSDRMFHGYDRMNGAVSDTPGINASTLDSMERESEAYTIAKASATPGSWHRGEWFGYCEKHPDGRHPGTESPVNPCVIIRRELTLRGEYASYVSSETSTLIGSDSNGAILSPADAEFIVLAKNTNLDTHVRTLIAEIRRLQEKVESACGAPKGSGLKE